LSPPSPAGRALPDSDGRALPDLNVLVAAAWPNHLHHRAARLWFTEHAGEGWATCPLTQSGFLRLSSNPRFVEDAVPPGEARLLLERMTRFGDHRFWPDDLDWTREWDLLPLSRVTGHQQITDAYLLALALKHGGRLVTLDRALPELLPQGSDLRRFIELLPLDPPG
jgi:toxin-antitoxin system PIN domain toxin